MKTYRNFLIAGIQNTRTYLQWGTALVSNKCRSVIEGFKILNWCIEIKLYYTAQIASHRKDSPNFIAVN